VTAAGQTITGAGAGAATITTTAATGDVLTVSGTGIDIGHICFNASIARTGGAFVNLGNTIQATLHDFCMEGFFVGVNIGIGGTAGGNSVYVEKGTLVPGVANGFGVQCNAGVVAVLRDLLIEGSSTGTQLAAGVSIGAFGDITLDHVETIWAGDGLRIVPPANTNTQAVFVVNSWFDTGSGFGINADATQASSAIQLLQIDTCWVASNGAGGISVNTSGTGLVQQTDIVNTVSSNNTNHGLYIGPRVGYTRCVDCSFSANSVNGIWVTPGIMNFQFHGNTVGASGEFLGNAVGITINNGCDNFSVADNNLNGNTTAAMNLGTLPGTRGVTYWIKDNLGWVTREFGSMTTTAGPSLFTVTHGLSAAPNVAEIRLTLDSGLGAAAYFYATNPTATTFQIQFNAAPGAGVVVSWEIRTLGN
jgi:hypothetical protein